MKLVSAWLRIPFWQRVVGGFVLGALAGWALGPAAETWFGPLGELYVTLIKMIAVPLVFFAVINAISSLHGQKSVAALSGRTFLWFVITAALAVCVGLGGHRAAARRRWPAADDGQQLRAARSAQRGAGAAGRGTGQCLLCAVRYRHQGQRGRRNRAGRRPWLDPAGHLFAGLVGFAIVKLGEKVTEARKLVGQMSDIMIQVTRFVLEVTPIGTLA